MTDAGSPVPSEARPPSGARAEVDTILLADDDPYCRALVRTTLGSGYRVLEAANGQEALDLTRSERPALVLLDVQMPRLSGFDVCRELKADPRTSQTRVILLTGLDSADDRRHGAEAGADGYLTKPFSPVALIAAVEQSFLGALGLPIEPSSRQGPDANDGPFDKTQELAYARELRRLYEEAKELNGRLQDLVARLLTAQEDERRRVAYDVHDGLAQVAAGTHQHLQAYARRHRPRSPSGRAELGRALELARMTVQEARRIIADLRPTALDDFGLATALRLEVEKVSTPSLEVAFRDGLGPERLAPAVETALFRVAREALTNVEKHARAAHVNVSLERLGQLVCLEVRDDGVGFLPAAAHGPVGSSERIGLAGMQERVTTLGGQWAIDSEPGAGTLVRAVVPAPRQESHVERVGG